MNETLLSKAEDNLRLSEMIWRSMDGDESYLNFIGYHLQQSVELAIKYELEQKGIDYPKTHDIDQLIRIANQNGADICLTEYVREHSEMFTLWEARTRYVLNYRVEMGKIERAIKEVRSYLDGIPKPQLQSAEDQNTSEENSKEEQSSQESDTPSQQRIFLKPRR